MEIQRYDGDHLELILDAVSADRREADLNSLDTVILNWGKKCAEATSCSVLVPGHLDQPTEWVARADDKVGELKKRVGFDLEFQPDAEIDVEEPPSDWEKKKSHLKDLIMLAAVDGLFDEKEQAIVLEIGQKMGLTERLINSIYNESVLNPDEIEPDSPMTEEEKLDHLTDLCRVILADGKIDDWESVLIFPMAVKMGFEARDVVRKLAEMAQQAQS